jgi:hypothetical protein
LPKVLFDGPYQQAAMRMYALFYPKQDAAARLPNPELKIVFLFQTEPAGIILFHLNTDSGSATTASVWVNLNLPHGINDGTCRAKASLEYFVDERPVNIFEKLADVPEDPARQISTEEIHGVLTDRQLYVLWQTTHMHQTSVKFTSIRVLRWDCRNKGRRSPNWYCFTRSSKIWGNS